MAVQGINQFSTLVELPSFVGAASIGLVGSTMWYRTPEGLLVPISLNGIELGNTYWVDTVNGDDDNSGEAPSAAFATVQGLIDADVLASNDKIMVSGDIREENVILPLGVYNLRIIGATVTRPHHDNATRWREAASHTALTPLLQLREQGCQVSNILFAPPSDAPAIRLKRAESATYPDASHCTINGNRFVGGLTGIEDDGGNHNQMIAGNIFQSQTDSGYECISTAIAVPLQNFILGNKFISCAHGFRASQSKSEINGNRFVDITTTELSTAFNAGQGNLNLVVENYFPNAAADITIANGYIGTATDIWRNFASDGTGWTVGVPA